MRKKLTCNDLQDQIIQESSVKIEHMERRMESVKKQAEAITELEGEVARATSAEKEAEATIEQLQAELDALEREVAKLKAAAPAEKTGRCNCLSLLPGRELILRRSTSRLGT